MSLRDSRASVVENSARGLDRSGVVLQELNRDQFLRLFGASAVGAALVTYCSGGVLEADEARASASEMAAATPGSLRGEFEAAAQYAVPVQILMALGYVNTRWEMPPIEVGEYIKGDLEHRGMHGIMALVENPFADTLGMACRLTGVPRYALKTNRYANIRGGAALLAEAIRLHGRAASWLEGGFDTYLEAIAGDVGSRISAFTGIGGGMLYARQVLDTMHSGASLRISDGELVTLQAGAMGAQSTLGGVNGR